MIWEMMSVEFVIWDGESHNSLCKQLIYSKIGIGTFLYDIGMFRF